MINNSSRHGTTCQQLGNVLSKDKDIVKVGHVKRGGVASGTYNICVWALKSTTDLLALPSELKKRELNKKEFM